MPQPSVAAFFSSHEIMHPTLILSIWLMVVLLIQRVSPFWLLAASTLACVVFSGEVRLRFVQLAYRSRWLLLTLMSTFLLLTPGERVLPGFPATQEGAQLGFEHLVRLCAVLLAVAWLVGGHSAGWLITSLRGGLLTMRLDNADRLIIRLVLVLEYAASGTGSQWRRQLQETDQGGDSTIALQYTPIDAGQQVLAGAILIVGCITLVVL